MLTSLRFQISFALLTLFGLFAAILAVNVGYFQQSLTFERQLSLAQEVNLRADVIHRKAVIYKDVAPRDYPAYNRDVLLFYPLLLQDLGLLDQSVSKLAAIETTASVEAAALSAQLLQDHLAFETGLRQQLGDLDEPRLEWGAEFLAANAPAIGGLANQLEAALSAGVDAQLAKVGAVQLASWIAGAIFVASLLLWFWLRVTRRVAVAADTCRKLADGEFGTEIDDASRDEIGQFSKAFNALSGRTRVVLGVLDRLPPDASADMGFETLWQESQGYLDHSWQGLFELDAGSATARLIHSRTLPGLDIHLVPGQELPIAAMIEAKGFDANLTAFWDDLRRHTLDQNQARLLRELSRRGLRTLALVKIERAANGPERLLAFAWKGSQASDAGVARFLGGLSQFLNRIFNR